MTIIEQTIIKAIPILPIIIVGAFVLLVMLVSGMMSLVCSNKRIQDSSFITFNLSAFIGILTVPAVAIICCIFFQYDTDRYSYKVKLDNSYTANELFENYTNVKYLGDNIYKIEDKNN